MDQDSSVHPERYSSTAESSGLSINIDKIPERRKTVEKGTNTIRGALTTQCRPHPLEVNNMPNTNETSALPSVDAINRKIRAAYGETEDK
jgi:hypothetical protein